MNKDIIPIHNGVELIKKYQEALQEALNGIRSLQNAKAILKQTFGEYSDGIIPPHFTDSSLSIQKFESIAKEITKITKKNFWWFVMKKLEIEKVLSVKKQKELHTQILEGELPEVDEANLFAFIQQNLEKAKDFAEEAIVELFDFLRPDGWSQNFKSNNKEIIGNCVKINGIIDVGFVYYLRKREELRAMDKLFHVLDSKQPEVYPNDLVSIFQDFLSKKIEEFETEYFRVKWFKKGSAHFWFKRMDLVEKINQIAGKKFIKGATNG